MRRTLVLWALVIAGAAVLLLLAGTGWLLGTTSGARWALARTAGAMPGGRIEAREIRGALASPLVLRDVRFASPSLELTAARIEARWSLGPILLGRLDVTSLEIDSVRVLTVPGPAAARPEPGAPPRLSDLRALLALGVGRLVLRDLDLRAAGDSAGRTIAEFRFAGRWRADRLRLDTLALQSPGLDADVRGEIGTAGPWRLDLSSRWVARPRGLPEFSGRGRIDGSVARWRVVQALDAPFPLSLDARGTLDTQDLSRPPGALSARLEFERFEPRRFAPRAPSMTIGGRVTARGEIERFEVEVDARMRSDSLPDLDLEAEVGRHEDRIRIHRLVATRPGRADRVEAQGWISGLLPSPVPAPRVCDLRLTWRSLAWPLEGEALVRSGQGGAHLKGTPRHYTLTGASRFATRRFENGRLSFEAAGDSASLQVTRLALAAKAESLVASGNVAWGPKLSWDAEMSAAGLDPAVMWPAWPGRVTVEARASGRAARGAHDIDARLIGLGGTLRGLALAGRGGVSRRGDHVTVDDLSLAWGDGRLELSGAKSDRWDVRGALRAPSLALIDSVARGRLTADFQIEGPVDTPRVRLTAHGDSLGFRGDSAKALDLSLAAGLRPEDAARLDVRVRNAVLSGVPLERLALEARGTTARHVLDASAFTTRESLFVRAGGGLERARWNGSLERLDLYTFHAGSWSLERAVPVSASAESVVVAPFRLANGEGSLSGEGMWSGTHGFRAAASLVALPLALLDPLMPGGTRIEGRLDGRLDARSAGPRGPMTASLGLEESPTRLLLPAARGRMDTLAIESVRLNGRLDAEGLQAEVAVSTAAAGRLEARLALPGFDPFAADRAAQPLTGTISANARLEPLRPVVPGIRDPRGVVTADLQLEGTVGRPELRGTARVKDAAITLAALGATFDEIQVEATPLPDGKLAIQGGARSPSGRLTLEGSLDPRAAGGATAKLGVKGENVTLMNTRETQVRVTPDLTLDWARGVATVGGRVDVPFARIQLAGLAPAAQSPSPDVVFVGATAESAQGGMRVRSRVRVGISDDVEVRGVGYRVKPEGSLLVIDEPDEVTRGTGELEIKEGTYKAYGQDLTIERGRVIFGGGPIANPGLDVRATRKADDGTVAGLLITGTATQPVLELFSVPSTSDANVLSYIMSGKPLDESSSGGLAQGATTALGVQGGDALARSLAGQMGLPEASVETTGGMQEASLFLGTYLSPRLYMAYGIGLFEDVRTLRLRYSVASRWSLQAESGDAQSGMIQYRGER